MQTRLDITNPHLKRLNGVIAELESVRNSNRAALILSASFMIAGLSAIIYSIYQLANIPDEPTVLYNTEAFKDADGNFSTATGISCHDLFPSIPFEDPCQMELKNVNFSYDFMIYCAKLLDASCKSILRSEASFPYTIYPLFAGLAMITLGALPLIATNKDLNMLSYSQQTLITELANDLNITFNKTDIASILQTLKLKRDELMPVIKLSDTPGLLWSKSSSKEANQYPMDEVTDRKEHEISPLLV